MRTFPLATTALSLLGLGLARAEPAVDREADAYCTYATSVAASQSALLFSPQLYVNVGYINGDDSITGSLTAAAPRTRLTAGLRYSVSETYQGVVVRSRAHADCRRYRALTQLTAFTQLSRDQVSRSALRAKLEVLEAALPHAAELVRLAEQQVLAGQATIEGLTATQLRVDALRATLAETRQALALAMASGRTLPSGSTVRTLQRERDGAEHDYERAEARFRRAQAWDVVVRGGYDRIFDVRDQLPLFAIASLAWKPGWFAQLPADRRAIEARVAWTREQSVGIDARTEVALREYRAVAASEKLRLNEAIALLADLEARWRSLEAMEGQRARAFRDYLWFDLIRSRAEVAYLKAHLAELTTLAGDGS